MDVLGGPEFSSQRLGDAVRLSLGGHWTVDASAAIEARADGLLAESAGARRVVLDLGRIARLDALDALLPMRESFDIPKATAFAVSAAKARGGRVIAIGTSVVRALEGCAEAHGGVLEPGTGDTELLVGGGRALRIVEFRRDHPVGFELGEPEPFAVEEEVDAVERDR